MVGADLEQMRALAASFERAATQLTQTSNKVRNGIQISAWVGPFAIRFRRTWDSEHSVKLNRAAAALSAQARQLRQEAEQQQHASRSGTGYTGTRLTTRSILGTDPNAGNGDGVRIQKVRGTDGKERVIVHIAGTNPLAMRWQTFDAEENLSAAAGLRTQTTRMIEDRMRDAGVSSTDEILFVGYSQGGLHAQNLARSGRWGDAAVITRGSPEVAGGMGSHDILRLEVEGDLVVDRLGAFDAANEALRAAGRGGSGVDYVVRGAAGAEARSWVDVIGGAGRELAIHTAGDAFYATLADDFDRSTDPDARRLQERLDPFLNAEVVSDTDD